MYGDFQLIYINLVEIIPKNTTSFFAPKAAILIIILPANSILFIKAQDISITHITRFSRSVINTT
jgi:hypothetical protein